MENIAINIKTVTKNGFDMDSYEFLTFGEYVKTDNGAKITYRESNETGYENSAVELFVKGGEIVTMNRTGVAGGSSAADSGSETNLVIEKGRKHHCHYGTPYGSFTVGITAKDIKSNLSEKGGSLHMKYTVDINSGFMSENEIDISVGADGVYE